MIEGKALLDKDFYLPRWIKMAEYRLMVGRKSKRLIKINDC